MDLQVVETGNGGDLILLGKDLAQVQGFENMIYLGLFGGNVAASTKPTRAANEQDFSWWGNTLLMPNLPTQQFNSQTERTLNNVSLTSGNLVTIQNAVNADLAFMQPFAKVSVSVSIIGVDKVKLAITVIEPSNLSEKQYLFIWDGTKQDLAGAPTYSPNPNPNGGTNTPGGLQYTLPIYL